ncbi:MAG TPA: glycine betaine ABC transporter substrate-binding protein [Acidimicrobiia bacterium]|nr:glycine betaine ABC transporter substrate-binding protein [Acidimicrobiia bacterium]
MNKRLIVGAVLIAMLAAACGDAGTTGDTTAATQASGDKMTISLIQNPWSASALNAEIAKVIIEQELGYPVEIVNIDENIGLSALAEGDAHAVLEVWPSGVVAEEQVYIDDGSVVDIGELGAIGKIGWFVPQYVIDENPELATWEGFQDPALAGLFATAETGENGRFLGTDPSYSQYDEAIIENLGLPLEVIFSGTEAATVAELDSRFAAGEPIVMYWWTPTAAVAKYDLVNVLLPEYSEDCYADPAAIDCDYPEDVLVKLAWSGLEEAAPDVFTFLSNFTITTGDQLGMLPAVEIDGRPAADVAADWVADNEAVWSAWLEG